MNSEIRLRAAAHVQDQKQSLAAAMTTLQFQRHPELDRRYGAAGRQKCHNDALFHLQFLAQSIRLASPALFIDYIGWAKVMLASRGVPAADLATNLAILQEVASAGVEGELAAAIVAPVAATIAAFSSLPEQLELLLDGSERESTAGQYLQAVLRGDRRAALKLVLDSMEGGASLQDVYLDIFERSQQEIGRMWQMNRISVAQEHFATAATQMLMSQLFSELLPENPGKLKALSSCVGDELHEIGLRIVTDLLELSGWNTRYLGANVPVSSIVDSAAEWQADLIALSTTLTPHLGDTERIISALRDDPRTRNIRIMVGGAPFHLEPGMWERIGADGYAANARQALEVASKLVH